MLIWKIHTDFYFIHLSLSLSLSLSFILKRDRECTLFDSYLILFQSVLPAWHTLGLQEDRQWLFGPERLLTETSWQDTSDEVLW